MASVQPYQALMHRVIVGLHSADARDAPLFEDDRWNSSRSTAPQHGSALPLACHHEATSLGKLSRGDVPHRSIAPIWDLLALGPPPDVCREPS